MDEVHKSVEGVKVNDIRRNRDIGALIL